MCGGYLKWPGPGAILTCRERTNWFLEGHCGPLLSAISQTICPRHFITSVFQGTSFGSLPQQPLQQKSPKLYFFRNAAFWQGLYVQDFSKGHICRRGGHVQPSSSSQELFCRVVSPSLSLSCAPHGDKTGLRDASTKYPERAGHSSDGQSNIYLSNRDLISFLIWQREEFWSLPAFCCSCFSIICPHFSYFWCSIQTNISCCDCYE